MIAALDWATDQLDAVKAFTQSDVDAEIYVEMPEGFAVEGHVLKLSKVLNKGLIYGSSATVQHSLQWALSQA